MASTDPELACEFLPMLRTYKDGRVERLIGTDTVPPGTDPQTCVSSKDVTIIPDTEVYVRLYLPNLNTQQKLPVLLYFHGGGFCVYTASYTQHHYFLNTLVAEAQVVAVSVNYRRAPEHPLPAAYDDCWFALQWVFSHCNGNGPDPWLNSHADFGRVFLAGESAGANIAHNVAMAAGYAEPRLDVEILGVALLQPYFWGSNPIGSEELNPEWKSQVDRLWPFVCPENQDNDDPQVNPVTEDAPSLVGLGCKRVLVCVAEKDIFKDRGWVYYQALSRSGWMGVVEIQETDGEGHCFHLVNLASDKAKDLITNLAAFFNSGTPLF